MSGIKLFRNVSTLSAIIKMNILLKYEALQNTLKFFSRGKIISQRVFFLSSSAQLQLVVKSF